MKGADARQKMLAVAEQYEALGRELRAVHREVWATCRRLGRRRAVARQPD